MIALAQQSNILDFPSVAPQGKSNEWFTPSRYIEAARQVMGSIDLDPASCELANRTVKASRYYTKQDDGLSKPWYGCVFCNPPYSLAERARGGLFKSRIADFSYRLVEEYRKGDVTQAILLAIGKIDAQWFQELWEFPICFANHRVEFIGKQTNPKNELKHQYGTIFVYLGPNEQKFIDIFSQFGTIAKRVSPPRHTIATPSLWEVAE